MKNNRFWWICPLLGLCGLSTAPAQRLGNAKPPGGNSPLVSVFQSAPRPLRQRLARAERALQEERFGDAVDELHGILTGNDEGHGFGQDFFWGSVDQQQTQTSIKGRALQLISTMPQRGRELYELRCGTDARVLLQEAIESGDIASLAEVSRKYFHTKSGNQATLLIGRYHLNQGRALAAALCFHKLIATGWRTNAFEPEASLLLATSWLRAGHTEKAVSVLAALRARQPNRTIQIGGETIPLFNDETQASSWLEKLVGAASEFALSSESQWLVFRGNATRNGTSRGGIPLVKRRWKVPLSIDPGDQQLLTTIHRGFTDRNLAALPAFHPLAVNNVILMRTVQRILAIDFETGKRIWEYPWFESLDESEPNSQPEPGQRLASGSLRDRQLRERIWEDSAYGQISSDGQSVFLIDGLDFATQIRRRPLMVGPGGVRLQSNSSTTRNKLVALSLPEQGKLRWIVGGRDGEDEPKLAGAFFLGAPLPLLGELYVIAEINGEIRLVVLDAVNGQLKWAQQLAHVESMTVNVDRTRRLSGVSPSYANGLLVCPTSAGAVVALDATSRSLLWGYQYRKQTARSRTQWRVPLHVQNQQPAGKRWADSSLTIADGRILLTPVESDDLHCLDLLTGMPVWQSTPRDKRLYVAAVHDGSAIFVGPHHVTSIALEDGQATWEKPLNLGTVMPSGRGFMSDGFYYLPTTGSELLQINLTDGTVSASIPTDKVLGNLVSHQDSVLSLNFDALVKYDQLQPLRKWVARQLETQPATPLVLMRQSELLLHDGQQQTALQTLRKAHDLTPADDPYRWSIRSLLVDTLFAVLRQDFANNRKIALEVESLIDDPQQHKEYQWLVAAGFTRSGEYSKAFEMYLKLAGLIDGGPQQLPLATTTAEVNADWTTREQRRVAGQLSGLLRLTTNAEANEIETVNQLVQAQWDRAINADGEKAIRQFLLFFDAHPLADRARLELAMKLVRDNPGVEAEWLLRRASGATEASTAAKATFQLAELLRRAGQFKAAAAQFKQLVTRWPDVVCANDSTAQDLFDKAKTTGELQTALNPVPWRFGQVQGTAIGKKTLQRSFPIWPVAENANSTQLQFDLITRGPITVRDEWGRKVQDIGLRATNGFTPRTPSGIGRVKTFGHLAVILLNTELLVVDLLQAGQSSILWRQSMLVPDESGNPQPIRGRLSASLWGAERYQFTNGSLGPVNDHGVYFIKGRQLICADLLTGAVTWTRTGLPPNCDLFGNRQHLFVAPFDSDQVMVFNPHDGAALGTRAIPPRENRVTTSAGHVLVWQLEGGNFSVGLRDLIGQNDLWRRVFSSDAKGRVVENDEFAVLQQDGKFEILSIRDGQTQVAAQVKPERALSGIYVFRSPQQYLLITNRNLNTPAPDGVHITKVNLGTAPAPMINGHAYAFSRKTGKAAWPGPATITRYSLPLRQPSRSPLLVFLRQVSTASSRNSNAPSQRTELICLDRRTGRRVFEQTRKDGLGGTSLFNMEVQPDKQIVQLRLSSKSFQFLFTDQPTPPEPPAQIVELHWLSPQALVNRVGGSISGGIKQLINIVPKSAVPAKPPEQNGVSPKKNDKP